MIFPVVLSGGSGSRLWPLSRTLLPKQFLPLLGDRTMLQQTLQRLEGLPGFAQPVLVCTSDHRFLAAEQMREIAVTAGAQLLDQITDIPQCSRHTYGKPRVHAELAERTACRRTCAKHTAKKDPLLAYASRGIR